MAKVSFKEMKNGTKEDYFLLEKHEKKYVRKHLQIINNL